MHGDLYVDAEVCVELARDLGPRVDADGVCAAIARCLPAVELVDLAPRPGEPESVVAGNVFHLAVAFGDTPIPLTSTEDVVAHVNGEARERARWPGDIPNRIAGVAAILAAVDERFRAGERIISGSITQVSVSRGDAVRADFGAYASITIDV